MRDREAEPVVVALPHEVAAAVPISENVRIDVAALSGPQAKVGGRVHTPGTWAAVIGFVQNPTNSMGTIAWQRSYALHQI